MIQTPLEALLSTPLNPPLSMEAPTYTFPPNTTLLISEEASPSFTTVYRGSVAFTKYDVQILEEAMPMWLIEYLLMNKIPPPSPPIKISFVLMPWPTKDPEERLPELLNT
jgi:WD repeat-containing protein 48